MMNVDYGTLGKYAAGSAIFASLYYLVLRKGATGAPMMDPSDYKTMCLAALGVLGYHVGVVTGHGHATKVAAATLASGTAILEPVRVTGISGDPLKPAGDGPKSGRVSLLVAFLLAAIAVSALLFGFSPARADDKECFAFVQRFTGATLAEKNAHCPNGIPSLKGAGPITSAPAVVAPAAVVTPPASTGGDVGADITKFNDIPKELLDQLSPIEVAIVNGISKVGLQVLNADKFDAENPPFGLPVDTEMDKCLIWMIPAAQALQAQIISINMKLNSGVGPIMRTRDLDRLARALKTQSSSTFSNLQAQFETNCGAVALSIITNVNQDITAVNAFAASMSNPITFITALFQKLSGG